MAIIKAPNKEYNGISASIQFTNGIGETNNPHLINWFKSNGYKVEDIKNKAPQETLLQDEVLTTIKEETINLEPKIEPKPKPTPRPKTTTTNKK